MVNKVSDILSNKPNAPSFYRILNMIGKNPNLAPDIDVREVKRRLRKHKKTMAAIKDYRDKRVDHWDTSVENEEVNKPLLLGTKRLLEELKEISNEIRSSHSSSIHAFWYSQQGDTLSLLEALKRKRAQDKKLIEYWKNKINHENKGLNCCEQINHVYT